MNKFFIFCAAIFCLLSALFYWTSPYEGHFGLDSPGYDCIAQNFAATNRLEDPELPGVIPIQVVGYSLFLGILYKLFGYHIWLIIIVQVILCLLAIFLMMRLTHRFFSEPITKLVMILSTLNIGFLVFSQFILTEILLMTLLVAWLERFATFWQTKKINVLLCASFIFGISTWVKPIALFFMPVWLCFVAYCLTDLFPLRQVLKFMLLTVATFCVPIILYICHNAFMHNTIQFVPTAKENLYFYFLAKVIAQDKQCAVEDVYPQIFKTFSGKNHNDVARWQTAHKQLTSYVYQKPYLVLSLWLTNCLKTACGLFSTQLKLLVNPAISLKPLSLFSQTGGFSDRLIAYVTDNFSHPLFAGIAIGESIWSIIRLPLIAVGLIWLLYAQPLLALLFITFSCYCTLITGHDGCGRYRMMFEPILIILAAIGIYLMYTYLRSRKMYISHVMYLGTHRS